VGKVKLRKYLKHKTIKETKRHLLRQSNTCALCMKPITNMKDATIDHIIPKSRGGDDGLRNLQLAHAKCNEQKGNRLDGWDPPIAVAAASTDTTQLAIAVGTCDRTRYPWETD